MVSKQGYRPNEGFIGKKKVKVANYLSTPLIQSLQSQSVQSHYETSKRITRFLKKRDLTFQKLNAQGEYQIFTVPVTSTLVPLQKSVFNEIEKSAQILIVSLRKVLQSIYGAPSIRESEFVKALPDSERKIFLEATENSPHYIKALHHPNMRMYPFFDNVGLDLVLTDEKSPLPFQILELNAGSPSGASNNANILEGIFKEDPTSLERFDRVMPNDHFQVLRKTYQSLGEAWTQRKDGVQVILPPGGGNGASPEIHQLAAYSGLIYCDPGQLFQDEEGWIRLRTVKGANPIVTAVYSRVNSDSALFSKEEKILLRDPESGEALYCVDELKEFLSGKPSYLRNSEQDFIPLESGFAIPGAVQAVLNRRLYLGGLNRLLDNKIILATLTRHAPVYFKTELEALGLSLDRPWIEPPECLPSHASAIQEIEKNPDEWVIKSPNLSGGNGVHILVTLTAKKRRAVIEAVKKSPENFAYQRVVRIGRIPVAFKQGTGGKYRFANLAADIRMWVFYGAKDELPRLTHNALVRYAPEEKGALSSIVNTSMGGGYAPFLVVDDLNHKDAVSPQTLGLPREPVPLLTELPAFVGAQLIQVVHFVSELRTLLRAQNAELHRADEWLKSLKAQVREIASFLHPRCMESVHHMIELVKREWNEKAVLSYSTRMKHLRAEMVSWLKVLEPDLGDDFFMVLDELKVFNAEVIAHGYRYSSKRQDGFHLGHLSFLIKKAIEAHPNQAKKLRRLLSLIKRMIQLPFPSQLMSSNLQQRLDTHLDQFCDLARNRLKSSEGSVEFAQLFEEKEKWEAQRYQETIVTIKSSPVPRLATEWEILHQQSLAESIMIEPEIKLARQEWLQRMKKIEAAPEANRSYLIKEARVEHFLRYPRIAKLQKWIDQKQNQDPQVLIELMSVLPYAAYNLRQFAIEKGMDVEALFSKELKAERFSILNLSTRKKEKLNSSLFSGECFAKKKSRHGLISECERYLWVAEEQSPFVQLYTIGHELVHAVQIQEIIELEKAALKAGGIATAKFLNFYGHFLSVAAQALDPFESEITQLRKPLFGLAELRESEAIYPAISEVMSVLKISDQAYEEVLKDYGSLHGYLMSVGSATRVKALREVIPALENAKNIIYAKECGLAISIDEVSSALPAANHFQQERYRKLITDAAKTPVLDYEALRIIASHQYHGVRFPRAEDPTQNLTLIPDPNPISLNAGYNQTQQ